MIWPTRLISLLALTTSLPFSGAKELDEYNPTIERPTAGTKWYIGKHYAVTWDTNNHPAHITNSVGRIQLVHDGVILDNVLADGFDILASKVEIQVPHVKPGTYRIVLFGDSGNWSPEFEIIS